MEISRLKKLPPTPPLPSKRTNKLKQPPKKHQRHQIMVPPNQRSQKTRSKEQNGLQMTNQLHQRKPKKKVLPTQAIVQKMKKPLKKRTSLKKSTVTLKVMNTISPMMMTMKMMAPAQMTKRNNNVVKKIKK